MKLSKFISYFFHPINFPLIGAIIYFILLPKYMYRPQEHLILSVVFVGTYVFPLTLVFLLRKFGLISSYHMETIEERKFPSLLFIGLSFIIGNWLFKSTVVDLLSLLFFGYGISLIIGYTLLYLNIKASLHMMAVAGLLGFLGYYSLHFKTNLLILFALFFILSGIIASARIQLNAHKLSEVLSGFLLGILGQIIIYIIYII